MLLNKQSTLRYQLVELQVPANSPNQKFYFADQPLLRDKIIEKIECYNNGTIQTAPSGYSSVQPNLNSYVTFATDNGREFIQNIPTWELIGINRTDSWQTLNGTFTFGPRRIVFPKSYVLINTPTPIANTYSYIFGVYYRP
jgi:hypothetical protein